MNSCVFTDFVRDVANLFSLVGSMAVIVLACYMAVLDDMTEDAESDRKEVIRSGTRN